ncbi:MAG: GDYXXLXY domain-containing protein [Alphaproteobacteria bacterium]|nr:GDYXXLXY domain-containing protein [Alphaproteobacteria bacterium]
MTKKFWGGLFFLPLVCLAIWTIFLAVQQKRGSEVKVAIQGYDPRDLLSGHYIQYQIDWDKTDCTQFVDNVCPKEDFCTDARWGRECRFYVPEKSASELDKLFRKFRSGDENMLFEVVYSYRAKHQAMAKTLLINGKEWRQFLLSMPQQ